MNFSGSVSHDISKSIQVKHNANPKLSAPINAPLPDPSPDPVKPGPVSPPFKGGDELVSIIFGL